MEKIIDKYKKIGQFNKNIDFKNIKETWINKWLKTLKNVTENNWFAKLK